MAAFSAVTTTRSTLVGSGGIGFTTWTNDKNDKNNNENNDENPTTMGRSSGQSEQQKQQETSQVQVSKHEKDNDDDDDHHHHLVTERRRCSSLEQETCTTTTSGEKRENLNLNQSQKKKQKQGHGLTKKKNPSSKSSQQQGGGGRLWNLDAKTLSSLSSFFGEVQSTPTFAVAPQHLERERKKKCGSRRLTVAENNTDDDTVECEHPTEEKNENQHEEQHEEQMQTTSSDPTNGTKLECLSDELLHKILCHLDPVSTGSVESTSKHLKEVVEEGRVWQSAMRNYVGDECARHLLSKKNQQENVLDDPRGAASKALAKQLVTLEGLRWTSRRVGGKVSPSRCNFSSCAVGSKIFIFGGDHCQQALNDTYVLDMAAERPEWKKVHMQHSPPGRFGHTIRALDDKTIVLFGGCGNSGLFNDVHLLDVEQPHKGWKQVHVVVGGESAGEILETSLNSAESAEENSDVETALEEEEEEKETTKLTRKVKKKKACTASRRVSAMPVGRVWHASAVVKERELVIFGGCDSKGKLLDDMHVLDLSRTNLTSSSSCTMSAEWRRVNVGSEGYRPPARIGHSLTVLKDKQVLVFGGIANIGPVRARDNSAFVIDLGCKEPKWTKLSKTTPAVSKKKANIDSAAASVGGASGAATSAKDKHAQGGKKRSSLSPSTSRQERSGLNFQHLPSPRLDHVCWTIPGQRQIVFGGSSSIFTPGSEVKFSDSSCSSKSDMFLLNTDLHVEGTATCTAGSEKRSVASWKKMKIEGEGPQSAWTHCACILDHGTRCVVLGGSKGQDWLVNELYELSIIPTTNTREKDV